MQVSINIEMKMSLMEILTLDIFESNLAISTKIKNA